MRSIKTKAGTVTSRPKAPQYFSFYSIQAIRVGQAKYVDNDHYDTHSIARAIQKKVAKYNRAKKEAHV